MVEVTEILNMLDWHMPPETQSKGLSLAKSIDSIVPFIQPQTPNHNKNVWENCASIIVEKSDEALMPHLISLLEWLQDMNWPGAFCILNRLGEYSDTDSIVNAISICLAKAKNSKDDVWAHNLLKLRQKFSVY